jgi:DNA-binding transcriptional ArsR family regulator
MMNMRPIVRAVPSDGGAGGSDAEAADARLDQVFAALSDPIRRRILQQLDGQALLVSELAAPFDISLQGVSRHIQVLVRAGLVQQERSGRISRCTLEAGPLLEAAVWLNRYAKYWQGQFDLLAATLAEIDERRPAEATHTPDPGQGRDPGQARDQGKARDRAHDQTHDQTQNKAHGRKRNRSRPRK